MNTETSSLKHIVAKLKTERDELRVRMHLAKEDLQDEWSTLEGKWEKLEHKLSAAKKEAVDSSDDVGSAAKLLAGEIKQAYQRIKRKL